MGENVKFTVIDENGHIDSWWANRKRPSKAEWVILGDGKYHNVGRWNTWHFRKMRTLWLKKYLGLQRLWIKGNPVPLFLGPRAKEWYFQALEDTAHKMKVLEDSDAPERVLRPRRPDWVMLIMIGIAAFGIGIGLGSRL